MLSVISHVYSYMYHSVMVIFLKWYIYVHKEPEVGTVKVPRCVWQRYVITAARSGWFVWHIEANDTYILVAVSIYVDMYIYFVSYPVDVICQPLPNNSWPSVSTVYIQRACTMYEYVYYVYIWIRAVAFLHIHIRISIICIVHLYYIMYIGVAHTYNVHIYACNICIRHVCSRHAYA